MLKIDELKVSYGGIEAVKGITFEVPERQIVTLIGANGAGKSTTLRTIAGLVKPAHGRIHLQGEDITGLSPDRIVSKGVTLVPEGRRVFPDLSVVENLKIGAYLRKDDLEDDLNWVYDLFPRLKERSWQAAGTLSGGEQQMLAVARALMSRPKIIMMDEPSLGLAPLVVKGIFEIIKEINKQGVTVLLIEQNANMALKIADLGYVLETGRITLTGTGTELKFRTGGDQGTYYGFGSVLAQAITTNGNGTKVTAVVSNGSQDNIEQMQMNVAQLGFVQSDVMSYAYNGERLFEGFPYADFSTVAALYMEQVQIVTCDPDIKSVADLEGKTVSIGASGSGVYYNALDILAAYDLTEDDINAQYQDFGASADALQDGKIDAAFVVAGAPTVAITTLATAKDTYLVGLDDEHIAKLQESSPYYEEYIIPEGTYEGVPETKTVAVVATVIARDDVSEDDVYNICYTIFENMDNLAHDKAGELDVEFASGVTAVPYHAGAAKYFAEKGFDVPTK